MDLTEKWKLTIQNNANIVEDPDDIWCVLFTMILHSP